MDLRGSVDCVYFLKGQCRNGGVCPFKHDPAKLPADIGESGHVKQSEKCYYFLQGRCSKGNQCLFRHDQTKLKTNLFSEGASNPDLVPIAYAASVTAPVLPVRALPPAKCDVMPSVQGHVSAPNGLAKPVRPSIRPLQECMHAHLEAGAGQRPSKLLGRAAEPPPATNDPLGIQNVLAKDRKRKDTEDFRNFNAGMGPSNQPSKPILQHKKVQPPAGPIEDTVFNAPKTIEEIRAQKKVKTETKPMKTEVSAAAPSAPVAKVIDKPPVSARTSREKSDNSGFEIKSALNTDQEPLEPQLANNEVIEDFDIDVDVIDDDDFEAQMRALEDAL
ncbi:hypothetical protein Ndes2526B_g02874 [Nannochloris sp. 'desiccata']|nr:putative Zinc finger CCCH domain-containing protein 6 [Chlorella desiccata (nom. nud.)]